MNRLQIQQGNQGTVEKAMFYTICLLQSTQVLLPTSFHDTTLQGFTQVSSSKGFQAIWKTGEFNEEQESNVLLERPPGNSRDLSNANFCDRDGDRDRSQIYFW